MRSTILGLSLLLAACGGPTAYAPASGGTGYSDVALEEGRYRISFAGNSLTQRSTVEAYMLYRAAEVTLASGHDWFRIADRDTETETSFRSTSTGFDRFGYPFHRPGLAGLDTVNTRPITQYEAFADIVVFDGEKPAEDVMAYDARSVIETLGPLVTRPAP